MSQGYRRSPLPTNWRSIRRQVLHRDGHRCQQCGHHDATARNLEVDHLNGPDDHRLTSLQTLCVPCHRKKTLAEAAEGRRRRAALRMRPPEQHPGIPPGG